MGNVSGDSLFEASIGVFGEALETELEKRKLEGNLQCQLKLRSCSFQMSKFKTFSKIFQTKVGRHVLLSTPMVFIKNGNIQDLLTSKHAQNSVICRFINSL